MVAEFKSIITTKNTKIDSLATLVNGQGVLLDKLTTKVSELTERVIVPQHPLLYHRMIVPCSVLKKTS